MGYAVDRAQVELKWERESAPAMESITAYRAVFTASLDLTGRQGRPTHILTVCSYGPPIP